MKVDFVRHGKTQNDVVIGRSNAPLIQEGVNQIQRILLGMSDDYQKIFSSDLLKCKQTAEILNQKLNLHTNYDSRLREVDFGSLAGKRFNEIDITGRMEKKHKEQEYDYHPYGGESVEDVKERVFAFVKDIKNNSRGKKILVVTHGGVIRLLQNTKEINEKIHDSYIHEFEFPE